MGMFILLNHIPLFTPPLNNKTRSSTAFQQFIDKCFFHLKNEEKHKNAEISTIDSLYHTNQSQRPRLNFYFVGVILCLSIYGKDFV